MNTSELQTGLTSKIRGLDTSKQSMAANLWGSPVWDLGQVLDKLSVQTHVCVHVCVFLEHWSAGEEDQAVSAAHGPPCCPLGLQSCSPAHGLHPAPLPGSSQPGAGLGICPGCTPFLQPAKVLPKGSPPLHHKHRSPNLVPSPDLSWSCHPLIQLKKDLKLPCPSIALQGHHCSPVRPLKTTLRPQWSSPPSRPLIHSSPLGHQVHHAEGLAKVKLSNI